MISEFSIVSSLGQAWGGGGLLGMKMGPGVDMRYGSVAALDKEVPDQFVRYGRSQCKRAEPGGR